MIYPRLLRAGAPAAAVLTLSLLTACGGPPGSALPVATPTVQALATQAASVAGTAVASPAAAATALATQAAPVATAAATVVAGAPLSIAGVRLDPADTTITLRNSGSSAVDLAGASLRVGDSTISLPAGARVNPGSTVTIHTARGTGSATDVYLGDAGAQLVAAVRPGARVAVLDRDGRTLTEFTVPSP